MQGEYNLEFTNHQELVKKKMKKFRKISFLTDLHIICQDGAVSMHKIILLQNMDNFSEFLCDSCDHHSETVLMLPDVAKSDLEKEVKNLYSFGNFSGLEDLFGFKKPDTISANEDKETKQAEYYLNSDLLDNNTSLASDIDNLEKSEENVVDKIKAEIIDNPLEDELQAHTFEIIQSRTPTPANPGILIVDKRFRYVCRSDKGSRKLSYTCASRLNTKCPAKAFLERDSTTGKLEIVKCATDDTHNHEAHDTKENHIVKKMQLEMIEMIKKIPSLTAQECLHASKNKFSQITEPQEWEEVLTIWENPLKYKNLRQALGRARKKALGLKASMQVRSEEVVGSMLMGRALVTL